MVSVSSLDVPPGSDGQPLVPAELWATFPPAAQAIIVALAQRVSALEAEVRDLKARLGQNSTNSSRPPSSDPPHVKRPPVVSPSGRRAGGQPGHVGHFRALVPPERVDVVVDHWPVRCVGCATSLAAPGAPAGEADYVPHQVTEVPPLRAVVTEHRLHRVTCPRCGARTRATLPPDVPGGAFGPRLQATVATLKGRFRLSCREVAEVAETVLEAPLSVGSVDVLCQATSAALTTPVAEAVATLPQAPVVNADETPWKAGTARPWLWVAVTALVTVFQIATSRSSQVIKDLLGEDYRGTLGTDRYAGYAWLDVAFRQVCWAHLRRDFQALVDRGGPAAALGKSALDLVRQLFMAWHQFRQGTLDRAGLQVAIGKVDDALATLLHTGQDNPDPQAAGLCRALLRLWPALWTFAEVEGVEPTNNAAERALRPAVLWRKGSFGTRSAAGARFVERLLTVTATCKQHGRSVFAYLTDVCAAAQCGEPVPALLPANT
ncbi:MAG: IS66 family transposase [Chloroflexota bacterium]